MRGRLSSADLVDPATVYLARKYIRRGEVRQIPELASAWGEFFKKCDTSIRAWLRRRGLRADDLADCQQEVWRRLLARLANFRYKPGRGRFRTWLYRVVRDVSTDFHRRVAWRCIENAVGEPIGEDPRCDDPATAFIRSSQIDSVRQALRRLQDETSEQNYRVLGLLDGGHIENGFDQTPDD